VVTHASGPNPVSSDSLPTWAVGILLADPAGLFPRRPWINGELAVDGREYAEAIADALIEAGFVVR
jgi:hypothetical protein